MRQSHVHAYIDYVAGALRREGIPVRYVDRNTFDVGSPFALLVLCDAPFEQYNREKRPGTWLRTIRRGETVHDVIAAYRRVYH